MEENKIMLNMGQEALQLAEEQEAENLAEMKQVLDIIMASCQLLSDMMCNHDSILDLTATQRYINAE